MENFQIDKLQNSTFSTFDFVAEKFEPSIVRSVAVAGEALYAGEMDYLWVRIFSRLDVGAIKQKEEADRFRKKVKRRAAHFNGYTSLKRGEYIARKLNICVLETKDPAYIRRVQSQPAGTFDILIRRCERYIETKRLAKFWRRYLEDAKIGYAVRINPAYDMEYALNFYGLKLFDVNAD